MSDQVKACPWCKMPVKRPGDIYDLSRTEDGDEHALHCFPGCGATGPWVEQESDDEEALIEACIAAWNTRTQEPEGMQSLNETLMAGGAILQRRIDDLQAEVERLRAALVTLKGLVDNGHVFVIRDAMPKREDERRLTHKWVGELLNQFYGPITHALAAAPSATQHGKGDV